MNYNYYFDKIYVISYIKNYDKRERLKNELKRIGIKEYEFIYSYDTTIINNPNNIDYKKLSVSFTHYDIIKKSYELNYNHILMIEDDVMFLKNVKEIHDLIEYNESLGYDINYYDYQYRLTDDDDTKQIFLTSCYSLNRQGMMFFIKNFEHTPFLIDGYMSVYVNDYHTIPDATLCYLDGLGRVEIIETNNTKINLSSKRICIQDGKFEIYNDEHGNICNLDEYNFGTKKSSDCIIIIPLYKDYLYEYEEMSLKQCIKVLSENHDILFINHKSLDIYKLFNNYNISTDTIKNNIECLNWVFDDYYFESVDNFNSILCNTGFYNMLLENNYTYMLLYELDAFVFYDNLQYWLDKDYDYIGAFAFDNYYNIDNVNKDTIFNKHNTTLDNKTENQYTDKKYLMNGGVALFRISYCIDIINDNHNSVISTTWHDHLLSLYSTNKVKFPMPIDTFDFCWAYKYDLSNVINNFKLPMFFHYYQVNNKYYKICKYKHEHEIYNNELVKL